ncbi:MAG: Panacea domain-containing protein [Clostridiales bacterium]|nr:Panacea domain-containing protein [Clostridiales bacterium]
MRDVSDFAKFFIKNGADTAPNTYDGNMKLQKLLVLADMAYLAQYQQPLFNDDILAFENGLVVEKVRLRYKNDYLGLKSDSDKFNPDFEENEYEILNAVLGVYGHLSAKELSDLNHQFRSWKEAYQNGTSQSGYHDKQKSIVNFALFPEDIEAVGRAIKAYKETGKMALKYEVVNGVTFYYDGMTMTDELIAELEKFSKVCDDNAYSICQDNGRLVIY